MIRYCLLSAVPKSAPIGIAIDEHDGLIILHNDFPLLGQRFKHIVVFKSSPSYNSEYIDHVVRPKLEVDGTWVVLP